MSEPAPRDAAAVVLWREGPRGREVFWVRRAEPLRFAGGWRAFPGGRLDPADGSVPVPGHAGIEAALRACAARELFEETGVLLAAGPLPAPGALAGARRALLEERLAFADLLARHALAVDAAALAPAGRWVTPPFLPLRYDARVFLARLPQGAAAEVWPGELAEGGFVAVEDALEQWGRGEALLHPPNLWVLQCLARAAPPEALALLNAPPEMDAAFVSSRVEFQRGIWLAALRTPTLPPATHTNCWLVALGDAPADGLAVVDPGSPWPEEQERLDAILAAHAREGRPARELWLTHAHPDHTGGLARLAARGLPLRAHPDALAHLAAPPPRALPVADGDLLAGRWRALHTPGHAAGHLAFLDERTRALLCGDLVSTLSTIVIDPPEGDLGEYVRQLERVRALSPRGLFPAHGPPVPDGEAKLRQYLTHRRERLAQVEGALAARPGGTLRELTELAYADTPVEAHPLAQRSCLAALLLLEREGRAAADGDRWRPAA